MAKAKNGTAKLAGQFKPALRVCASKRAAVCEQEMACVMIRPV
jgi:hypothetical protein